MMKRGEAGPPEGVLVPGLPSSIIACIGLWIFAWTSRTNVTYIAPCIGVALFAGGNFISTPHSIAITDSHHLSNASSPTSPWSVHNDQI